MTKDLAAWAAEKGVKYFMVSYTDLFGGQRAKLVPAQAINDMAVDGAGFAGFATWLDLTPAHPDMMAVPDPSSVIQLPWKKEVAWLASNCVMEGAPVAQAPRNVLRRLIDEAATEGLRVKTGVEPEFFLLTPAGDKVADPYDNAEKPCYDQQAVMRQYDVISEVCDYMLELGWEAYQNDHEDAIGQFEMNWKYDDALQTADKHSFFKFMMKSVAEKHGFRATFMPKPIKKKINGGNDIIFFPTVFKSVVFLEYIVATQTATVVSTTKLPGWSTTIAVFNPSSLKKASTIGNPTKAVFPKPEVKIKHPVKLSDHPKKRCKLLKNK